jgi:putative nucleotide binding protein
MKNVAETKAIVLDYLPYGREFGKKLPIVQGLGKEYLTLLEFIKPKNLEIKILEEIPILVKYKIIKYEQLTETARINLKKVLEKFIKDNENLFIEFINKSVPLTPRLHMLELLPYVGKKITWKIIEEKQKDPFKSFEDLKNRVKTNIDLKKAILQRIIEEYQGKDKYKLFVGSNSFFAKTIFLNKKSNK